MSKQPVDFAAMLRIKNESRWISDVLESLQPLCERVFVLDDHSTDNTVEICQRFENVTVFSSPFAGLNEARDKNHLFERVMENCRPTWIACVDGDEVLAPGSAEKIREQTATATCDAFSFQIVFLWDDPKVARVDRIYGEFWRPSLFRPFHPREDVPDDMTIAGEFKWLCTPFGRKKSGEDEPNLHCSSVPQRLLHGHQRCQGVQLLHYGYLDRSDRVRKLDYYTDIDWKGMAEGMYRHMCQGDGVTLDELPKTRKLIEQGYLTPDDAAYMIATPKDAYLVHAGPLELRPL